MNPYYEQLKNEFKKKPEDLNEKQLGNAFKLAKFISAIKTSISMVGIILITIAASHVLTDAFNAGILVYTLLVLFSIIQVLKYKRELDLKFLELDNKAKSIGGNVDGR